MKNIFKFLSRHKLAVFTILLLLIAQAYCDLALPTYTSDLLNVGLQQGGIENAVLKSARAESIDALSLFMTAEEAAFVGDCYDLPDEDGIRHLKKNVDTDKLNRILLLPECILFQAQSMMESGNITHEGNPEQMQNALSEMKELSDMYLNQIAVNYVSSEYSAQGLSLNKIRNHYLLSVGAKMLAMSLFMTLTSVIAGLISAKVSAKIGKTLRQSLYEKVMRFTNAEMENFSTASLITRATNDIQQIQMVTVVLLRMVAYAPILAIGGVIHVIGTKSGMSWIIVVAVAILISCIAIVLAVSLPKFKKMQTLVDRLNLVSREMLSGIMPIRAFSREKHEEKRFDVANKDLYNTQLFTNRAMTFMSPVMMFVMNGLSVLIVWVGARKIDNGILQVGNLTAFIAYSMVIVMGFLMLSMIFVFLPRAGIAADRIVEVLDTDILLKDCDNPRDAELSAPKGIVRFSDVSFRYPGAEENALENISFTAEPGKTTAIIGSTGCGKSTLIKLIPRFFDVSDGSIAIDGIDIRELTQHKLRDMLGYVPQKGMLFSGTIESNLKFGGDEITDDDIIQAAEIAQATDFIESKPDKYETAIAQEGSNVSGGQRQRLSIARAIAKHPKIFLFDDSFSALDYKTDLALRKVLAEKISDATVIIVAQRISTILHADQIIVLDDGKIAGIGTHEQLLSVCKTYQEIAKSQLSEAELRNTNVLLEGGNC
ncbi:MAG: ABC transporter ATP-binding protein [Eubacteriales bacterium]|nr:ABC transporter ATP-binding protein [Lachnospiraceae bacterium]MDO5127368.1 ABC transporter ATP-binding protein [Eubacteriales bacterium]